MVGAGPDDPKLLTPRAYKVLQTVAVMRYNNLTNQELLVLAPTACECIHVAKKTYDAHTPQEVVYELIREKAFSHGWVVRLKGGDPFIFGRGIEEMLFARSYGIAARYMPGIRACRPRALRKLPRTVP